MKKVYNFIIISYIIITVLLLLFTSYIENYSLLLIIFGQLFLLVGIIFTKKSDKELKSSLISLFVALIGFICISIGISQIYNINIILSNISYVIPFIMILVGFFLLFEKKIDQYDNKKNSVEIISQIVDLDETTSSSKPVKKVYSPIYKYKYGNKEYTYNPYSYSNVCVPQIGSSVIIYINPENPSEPYIEMDKKVKLFNLFMGILLIIVAIYLILII